MKKLLLLSLLLILAAFAWADVYPIGTLGTSTSSVYGPFTGLWDYSWTKTIVTATEMTAAGYNGTDNITGVGYHIGNSPSNYTMLGLHMFIRHTTLSSYTDLTDETGIAMPDSAAFTQVFSGDLTFNGGGWYYISFNLGSFDWDGTSNIEIFWKNWDGTYVSGYPNWTYASTGTDYKVVYKNQDDSFPTSNGARYTNRTNLAIVTPATTPPNPAMLVYPTNAGWTFLNGVLSWSPTGGGITDGYDVYLDTVDGSTLVSDNQTGTSYTPTLAPGTTYYWKVVPYNAAGPAANCPVWSFRTPTATQLAESFENTTFPPAGWTNPGSWNRSTTSPFHGAACAYKYASSTPVILSTPLLAIDGSSTLDFWYRSAATTGIGQIKVLYSTDRQNWTQVGTTIAMPTNTTWNNTSVALGTIPAGNYYLAFEASSSTTSSTSVYIDHVFGPEAAALPPEPASLVYPLDNGWTFLDGTLSWTASMNGGLPSSYDVYLGTSNPPSFVANQTGTSYAPTLAAGTTYYWQIVPRNDTGTAANCPVWSFKTPTDTQLAESFDATTFPPVGWVNPNSWSRSTTTPYYGAGCAYKSASTTAAILSTPLLAIDANSVLDFFYRTGSTTGYGLLNVKYSTDRQNWNQIGATIAMPTTTTWNNASVALGTIPAGNYYLAFEVSTSTSTASIYIDHVVGPEAATVAPDPVTLTAPADAAVDVVLKPTFTWTAATIGGIPTGYKVYCDTNTNPVTQIADVSTTSYTATTALAYSTTYYWKVVAYNANGNSADSEIRSFTTMADPTIYTFPWLEDFGTTGTNFPPMNWTRWSGLLTQDPVTLTSASGYWVQDDFANIVTSPTNKSARINIYGATTIRHWLMTPPIQMPGTGYQLEFDIALTDYNYAEPITSDPNGTTGVDDRFVVLISDGNSWSTANAVKIWDNDDQTSGGIYEVYNDVPHTGAHYILPLDNYTGIKYVAFYAESTVSNADNDFFVDNVLIRETPVAAVFTIAPAITSWDFGMVPVGGSAEKEFAVTNTGPGNLIVSSITQTGTHPPFSIVPTPALPWSLTSADPANTFKVVFTPQTAGGPFTTDVTVTYNNGAQATYTISFTGSAYLPATLPLTEGWENGQGNWITVNGTQTNKWHIGAGDATYGPYEGDNFAYISNDEGTTVAYGNTTSVVHIYRDIAFDADCLNFPLSFQWRCRGEGAAWDRMRVYLVDTSVTPVAGAELTTGQVGLANYNLQTAWTAETITLPGSLSGTVKRLVFSWRNDGSGAYQPPINIDNISLTAVPIPSGPVVAPNLDYPADRQTDLPKNGFSFQFSWNMAGSEPDTYNLYLANVADLDPGYTSDDFFAAAIPYEDISSPYRPSFTYVYGETYVWTVVGFNAAYPDEVYQWPPYEFTIEPDPTITNFPWDEDFEDGVFPPIGWTVVDVDGGGTYWDSSTNYNHTTGGTTSARHGYSTSVPAPGQNGWLITPPAAIPNSTNNVFLSWWNYNYFPTWLVYNGVKVNTTNDPADPNWVELWSQDSAASSWSNEVLDINAYKGQTVYFAFHYQGYNADDWYVDDVSIYEVAATLDAPVVTIALTAGQPTLSWDAVTGANSYLVYGATDPYAADPWTLLDTVYTTGYTYTGTAAMEFFKVVASDVAAPARGTVQPTPQKNTQIHNAPKVKLDNGPQGDFRIRLRK